MNKKQSVTPAENDSFQKIVYSQWISLPDNQFVPSLQTVDNIPAGLYELKFDNQYNNVKLIKKPFELDELYLLPSPEIESILSDIKSFWRSKELFKKYKFVHKRGILLYGLPGCGKSGIVQLCMKHLIDSENGLVINLKNSDDVEMYVDYISNIRHIEGDRPLIVLLEDIDGMLKDDGYTASMILNVLDGVNQINDVCYIATTNKPEVLEERITNRPSRFDRRYCIELPSEDIRKAYITNKIGSDFSDIDLWVKETKGMSIAHLRELVISVIVLGNTFDDTIYQLKELKEKPKNKEESNMGFM